MGFCAQQAELRDAASRAAAALLQQRPQGLHLPLCLLSTTATSEHACWAFVPSFDILSVRCGVDQPGGALPSPHSTVCVCRPLCPSWRAFGSWASRAAAE